MGVPSDPPMACCSQTHQYDSKTQTNSIVKAAWAYMKMFLVKVRLRSTTHPLFDPTGIRTKDSTFYVSETLALTTEPSDLLNKAMHCHIILEEVLRWSYIGSQDRLVHWQLIVLVQVRLKTEVRCTKTISWPFTFPGKRCLQQPAAIDPTLNLCPQCPLQPTGWTEAVWHTICISLPNTSTHDQYWEFQSPDLVVLSPMPYLLGNMLLSTCITLTELHTNPHYYYPTWG